ncbi:MAG: TIM barrel protein, partial [Planctomycetes bacterium]|nr:TIM barrel protein [Planctomycetota bacterium]
SGQARRAGPSLRQGWTTSVSRINLNPSPRPNLGVARKSVPRHVVERIRAAAPRARSAGVTLAIENTLPATENLRILERIGHDSVKIYYDVFNTGVVKGYDVPKELRLLKDLVAQVHFKNGGAYMDERKGYFEPIVAALNDINYAGWIVLETSNPSKNPVADTRRNVEFVRRLYSH